MPSGRGRRASSRNIRRGNNKNVNISADRQQLSVMRKMLEQLQVMAPSAPPEVRDVSFPLVPRNQTFQIRRAYTAGVITSSTLGPSVTAYNFQLSQFPDFADFTALFDQYRFKAVRVTFIPNMPTSTTPLRFYTAIDYDDSSTTLTVNQIQQYDSLQVSAPDSARALIRTIKPKFSTAAYSGAFTSYSVASGWVDAGSPNVQWYGLKCILEQGTVNQTVYAVEVEALLQFKYIR